MKRGFLLFNRSASTPCKNAQPLTQPSAHETSETLSVDKKSFTATSRSRNPLTTLISATGQLDVVLPTRDCQITQTDINHPVPVALGRPLVLWSANPIIYRTDFDLRSVERQWNFLYGPGDSRDMVFIGTFPEKALEIGSLPAWSRPPPLTSHVGFNVKPTQDKGVGVFAAKEFRNGDVVLSERPILIEGKELVPEGSTVGRIDWMLHNAVEHLADGPKAAYQSLSILKGAGQHYGILAANRQVISYPCFDSSPFDGCSAVFETFSRINHSCTPNAAFRFHPDTLQGTVYAIKSIRSGEEISISYINPHAGREIRRESLRRHWDFDCRCECCELRGQDRDVSDNRRSQLGELDRILPGATVKNLEYLCRERQMDIAWSLAEEEGLGGTQLTLVTLAVKTWKRLLNAQEAGIWSERGRWMTL
ncbi:hypothetical protein P7C70_g8187, partial [Phenoliferia sp. Uapishka_3]